MAPYVHTHRFRIAMAEVDMAQIHFTAIYRWMDRGLSEWLAAVGHPFTALLEHGPGIPIVASRARFLLRVLLDDELELTTTLGGIRRTSFRSRHRFSRDGELAVDGELVHVCVDRTTRVPVPVPEWLRELAVPRGDDPADDSV
jgi:YbgC/YbaW family acyl-CoA thioester hydrolase